MFGFSQENSFPPTLEKGVLFDFSRPSASDRNLWGAVDDVVMGGVSSSTMVYQEGVALFSGNVSTENSGGFASVRTRNFAPPLNLSAYEGIRLAVKGDGNRYKLLLRDAATWDGIAFSYAFDTFTDQWTEIPVLFRYLVPVFRARIVSPRPTLTTSHICALQLMLSKFEYDGMLNSHFRPGSFQLAIRSITVL